MLGSATGFEMFGLDNPFVGVQEYDNGEVPVPLPLRLALAAELQAPILWSVPAFAEGKGSMVTLTASVAVHPYPLVTVNVYVVFAVGSATGLEILGLLSPVVGDQEYVSGGVPVPEPFSVAFGAVRHAPILISVPAFAVGEGFTVTVIEAALEQAPVVPVTV
jgi:hypothetical protein